MNYVIIEINFTRKQGGNNCKIMNEEIVAVADELLEYKCIATKQHNFLLLRGLN